MRKAERLKGREHLVGAFLFGCGIQQVAEGQEIVQTMLGSLNENIQTLVQNVLDRTGSSGDLHSAVLLLA